VKPFAPVFFVSESEYPKLQAACPGDFPFTYAQFVKRVDDGISALGDTVRAVRIEVSVSEFLAWCSQSKRTPDNRARAEYVAHTAHKQGLN
jgi:hypothetical protein